MSGLLLAGGGHSHALLLRRWAMRPEKRPEGLITLVSRSSTALYSGMVPGLIADLYRREQVEVNLRDLAEQAGVAIVIAEITGIDTAASQLQLSDRPNLPYDHLSLNLGAVTNITSTSVHGLVPIKPLEPALAYLNQQDDAMASPAVAASPFWVVGSGLAAVETVLALRQRWPDRPLKLQALRDRIPAALQRAMRQSQVELVDRIDQQASAEIPAAAGLLCTGSQAPSWLAESGLPCCPSSGRLRTGTNLQVLGQPKVFAAGDCAVLDEHPRSPSGVWAVRAAAPLARNLEATVKGIPLKPWKPQRQALQLLGGFHNGQPIAWALRGSLLFGPHPLLWRWKRSIDARFMVMFERSQTMDRTVEMACRGCAAKLPAAPLERALQQAGIGSLGTEPEDAAELPVRSAEAIAPVLQSVHGFPALISDPWLNGRLSALHACSDLWACGALVTAAQAVVTLPETKTESQEMLLAQTLAGIRSALDPQGAQLIGGHTLEARDGASQTPLSRAVQVVLNVSGQPRGALWPKAGLQAGDRLLLSRPLGTGVLFAAAMSGAVRPDSVDAALRQMATSQHSLVESLQVLDSQHPGFVHAATDVTGFGLLGHLGEMLRNRSLRVELDSLEIPALPEALTLLEAGQASSLAPANRRAWARLDDGSVDLQLSGIRAGSPQHQALLELLVDPQTCGPLLISVSEANAAVLLKADDTAWTEIGRVKPR